MEPCGTGELGGGTSFRHRSTTRPTYLRRFAPKTFPLLPIYPDR
jgi:hypothetical protein